MQDGTPRRWRARYLRRCQRPRHAAGGQVRPQAQERRPRQRGDLRPLPQRAPARGSARRQHQHLLVRPRLVLVHSAGRRQHQRRRGVLALLPEVARQAAARILRRHHRAGAGAARAAARGDADRRHGLRHRQLHATPARVPAASATLLLGDAFAFIDPVFSSGVYLAMRSAFARRRARGHRARPSRAGAGGARARYREHGAQGAAASSRGSSTA